MRFFQFCGSLTKMHDEMCLWNETSTSSSTDTGLLSTPTCVINELQMGLRSTLARVQSSSKALSTRLEFNRIPLPCAQKLRPLVVRGTADGQRHRALASLQEAEALLADDLRFARTPRFDRQAPTSSLPHALLTKGGSSF